MLLLASNDEMVATGLLLAATILGAGRERPEPSWSCEVRNDLNMVVITFNSLLWKGGAIVLATGMRASSRSRPPSSAPPGRPPRCRLTFALRAGRISLRPGRPLLRPLTAAGIPVAISGLLILAYARIDQVLVYEFAGAREAGLYAAAYRILEQSHFVPLAVATTFLPLVAAAHGTDIARARRMTQHVIDYMAVGSFPALGFTLVASEQVISLLFGDAFLPAAPALPILMAAFVVICFGYLSGNLVIVLGLQRRFLVYAVVALVFNVALNVILIPPYGFLAAAWVTLATEVVVVGLTMTDGDARAGPRSASRPGRPCRRGHRRDDACGVGCPRARRGDRRAVSRGGRRVRRPRRPARRSDHQGPAGARGKARARLSQSRRARVEPSRVPAPRG